jgi:hypothetical protein
MGSGMLPSGAYVTLEHEYILIFRKGEKKEFKTEEAKKARMQSSFFWEERNKWFSDLWDFKGTSQILANAEVRSRSAAYPFELAYRLVNMYSQYGNTVLDPFLGTGTTTLASIACGRNSIGVEIDEGFSQRILDQAESFIVSANTLLATRIANHRAFVASHAKAKGPLKHLNIPHGFPVVTKQETAIQLYKVANITIPQSLEIMVDYES